MRLNLQTLIAFDFFTIHKLIKIIFTFVEKLDFGVKLHAVDVENIGMRKSAGTVVKITTFVRLVTMATDFNIRLTIAAHYPFKLRKKISYPVLKSISM